MIPKDTLELIQKTAQQAVVLEIKTPDGGEPFVLLPNGGKLGLAEFYPPQRIKQTITLTEAQSFADYVNRYKTGRTIILAQLTEDGATFVAIFDYHGAVTDEKTPLEPGRLAHLAKFATITTPEWNAWSEKDREVFGQLEFAEWIEENLKLFTKPEGTSAPTGAELLDLVRTLHGHSNARFNTTLRLQTGGHSVSYDEDVQVAGQNSSGKIDVPPTIIGGFKIFEGGEAYRVDARLKLRVESRSLKLWYETINKHAIVRENILAVAKLVGEKTGIVPLLGHTGG